MEDVFSPPNNLKRTPVKLNNQATCSNQFKKKKELEEIEDANFTNDEQNEKFEYVPLSIAR